MLATSIVKRDLGSSVEEPFNDGIDCLLGHFRMILNFFSGARAGGPAGHKLTSSN